jgi:serine protease Do
MDQALIRGSRSLLPLCILALTAALGGCDRHHADAQATPASAATATVAPSVPAASGLPDFRWLVKKYGGAVVNVNVVGQQVAATDGPPQLEEDSPLSEFFRRFGIPGPGSGPDAPDGGSGPPLRGLGSGFIVSSDGYVITNAHVVLRAATVTVKLLDRREFAAKVIGVDERSDVAVLKIDGRNLPTVQLGDPARVEAGEWVAAIGAPFGFENSVTVGVVSATSRALGPQSSLVPFIQTDVAVNPGNSGGPLFNLRGEVIGVNSQIYSQTGGYQGISFAIPIDVAMNVERQLVSTGRVTRGRIGVAIQDVNAQLAQSFKLDRPRGALVSAVEPNGPAAKAGLRSGDIILGVNGKSIATSSELPSLIANAKPGATAELQVWRNGREEKVAVRVDELKDQPDEPASGSAGPGRGEQAARLGMAVRPLSPDEQRQAQTQGGVLVEQASGPAAEAGIEPGDIVLAVGDTPVRSVDDLRKATQSARDSVALLVQRGNAQLYVPVRIR